MTYTKQQLEQMSDFEVNKALAGIIHGEEWWHKYGKVVFINRLMPTDSGGYETRKSPVDYCNNWSDIMPLAVENKICFVDSSAGFIAFAFCDDTEFESISPQRALACCLVLVLQGRTTAIQPA